MCLRCLFLDVVTKQSCLSHPSGPVCTHLRSLTCDANGHLIFPPSQDFQWALGLPNAVLSGLCQSPCCKNMGQAVSLILLISSPNYNAATGSLTYAATKVQCNNE